MTPHLPGPAALHCPGAVDDPSSPPPRQPRAWRLLLVQQRLATDLLQGLVKVFRNSFSHFVFWKSGVFFAFRIRNILLTRVTVNLIVVRTAFLSTDPIFSLDLVLNEESRYHNFTLTLSKGSMCIFSVDHDTVCRSLVLENFPVSLCKINLFQFPIPNLQNFLP